MKAVFPIALILLLVLPVSCAGDKVWVHRDRPSPEQRQREYDACRLQARADAEFHTGLFRSMIYYDALEECMQTKGYFQMNRKEAVELKLISP